MAALFEALKPKPFLDQAPPASPQQMQQGIQQALPQQPLQQATPPQARTDQGTNTPVTGAPAIPQQNPLLAFLESLNRRA